MTLDPIKDARERFYELVWPLRADVLRLARILTGSDADADDLAQETLLKAFNAIDRFRDGTDMRAWLVRILRNARIDRIRSQRREEGTVSIEGAELDLAGRSDGQTLVDLGPDPSQVLNAFSDQQVIDALQGLPEEIRLTLLLVDVQQLDLKDAAEILHVPLGTIKSRTHRGRAMLRRLLLPRAREMRFVK
jgi:RNA polymerase sigma-70 factor (ECF subfamily)